MPRKRGYKLRIKGIVAEPMPASWYSKEDAEKSDRAIDVDIVADRKPYFMSYRYPTEHTKLSKFTKQAEQTARILFNKSLDELDSFSDLTKEEQDFLTNYQRRFPVIDGGGTMNRLCHEVEKHFQKYPQRIGRVGFDYSILKADVEYSSNMYKRVWNLYQSYQDNIRQVAKRSLNEYWTSDHYVQVKEQTLNEFRKQIDELVPDSVEQCEILLDICYQASGGKNFVWDLCAEQIIQNLLSKHNGEFRYFYKASDGHILYHGERFAVGIKKEDDTNEYVPDLE